MGTRHTTKRDTLVIVRDAARSMGATVIGIKKSMKHPGIMLRTDKGVEFTLRVTQGKTEPHKQIGWLRQAINRANKRKANDNGVEQDH